MLHWAIDFLELHPWILLALIAHFVVLGSVAYLILLERWTASWVQDRLGPNRVGFDFGLPFLKFLRGMHGLGQPLADGLKFIMKEDYRARNVDKVLFTIAPAMMVIVMIISIAVLPMGGVKQTTHDVIIGSDAEKPIADFTPADMSDRVRNTLPSGSQVVGLAELQPNPVGVLHWGRIVPAREGEQAHQWVVTQVTYRYPFQIASLNIGVLFILAVLSLSVYGVVIGGWASNNKYSFLGGLRATANMISYEIPLGLAVLCIVVMFGSLDLEQIVDKQAHYWFGIIPAWNVFCQPLAFLMFLICIHAEANRAPFDMAEAEQELVGGYHTEYSAMRFALFFLGEYAGMVTTSAVCVALFFGGWHVPGMDRALAWVLNLLFHTHYGVDATNPAVIVGLPLAIARALAFFVKTLLIIFVFMWVRWSLPRFRFDQLMMLAWRALIPISLALLLMTAIVVFLWRGRGNPDLTLNSGQALVLFLANVVTMALIFGISVLLPAPPDTNRKMRIPGSRFMRTPLPQTPIAPLVAAPSA